MPNEFYPRGGLRNPHVQSILASSRLRRWLATRGEDPLAGSEEHTLQCADGVRLQGFYNRPTDGAESRGLVVLLHGWEGCATSTYMVTTTARLLDEGYAVFRLNFRDHGGTQHLNEGIFHSCRIDEVVDAVRAVSEDYDARPLYLAGFSLGGNFALRVALRAPEAGIPLARTIAISPVINPSNCLQAMESAPFIYRRYFIQKWRKSLRRKQLCFPHRYDFGEWLGLSTVRSKTDYLARRYTGFDNLQEYLDGYSVARDRLAELTVPSTIITARDDPIIPVSDLEALRPSPHLTTAVVPHGGHCGFIADATLQSWAEQRIVQVLRALD